MSKVSGWIVGEVKRLAHDAVPPGWLYCDGSAISRETYSELFKKIGTRWGTGDGSTTFNLPPVGIFSVNWDPSQTEYDTVGGTGGSKAATMPSHTHTISPNPHSHSNGASSAVANPGAGSGILVNGGASTTGTQSLTIGSAGGSGDNNPPYGVFMDIICYTADIPDPT